MLTPKYLPKYFEEHLAYMRRTSIAFIRSMYRFLVHSSILYLLVLAHFSYFASYCLIPNTVYIRKTAFLSRRERLVR